MHAIRHLQRGCTTPLPIYVTCKSSLVVLKILYRAERKGGWRGYSLFLRAWNFRARPRFALCSVSLQVCLQASLRQFLIPFRKEEFLTFMKAKQASCPIGPNKGGAVQAHYAIQPATCSEPHLYFKGNNLISAVMALDIRLQ